MTEKEDDGFTLSDEEMLLAIPRIKLMLQRSIDLCKANSDALPNDSLRAALYRQATVDSRAFLWCIETAGRMARTAQSFQQALDMSVKENQALTAELPSVPKKDVN